MKIGTSSIISKSDINMVPVLLFLALMTSLPQFFMAWQRGKIGAIRYLFCSIVGTYVVLMLLAYCFELDIKSHTIDVVLVITTFAIAVWVSIPQVALVLIRRKINVCQHLLFSFLGCFIMISTLVWMIAKYVRDI